MTCELPRCSPEVPVSGAALGAAPPPGRACWSTDRPVVLAFLGGEPAVGGILRVSWHHDTMTKNITVRLPDELAAEAEAVARAEGRSLNETVKQALAEVVERKRQNPAFKKRLRQLIEQDRELLERLAK